MKVGFVLSVYNKIDDLMAHLDVLKYCPFPHETIITCLNKNLSVHYLEEMNKYSLLMVDGVRFSLGPLLSFLAGIREANRLGLDYVCYRNSDDWLMNYTFESENFNKLYTKKYLCGAYNWFSKGTYKEFAMNQFYVHVPTFASTCDQFEEEFRQSKPDLLCEFKIPQWILSNIKTWNKFYRIPNRETELGIGHDRAALLFFFNSVWKADMPKDLWEKYWTNNRFFNEDWQLIGSHDNWERLGYWMQIRNSVPYAAALEKEHHFARWITAATQKLPWNLPNSSDNLQERRMPKQSKKAKLTGRPVWRKAT